MGDIADAIVEGEICQICCGNPPDEPLGYPFTCAECGYEPPDKDDHPTQKDLEKDCDYWERT